ncbi:hypothetical protein INS49_007533 [Diaporthe citri]|uniref:uncharacterized protein n=1 Tax=Diaporthe citri TaxID=83186 RepID=UPI001C7E644B|nr:uncharacterized protein INS49_007533 [Diaporthe citri]KAG6353292.1 hypothetical protein INS49_007533 [Diaporthe citri]
MNRIPELALKHNAILVSPDYRLRPEATLADIIDDIRDFWVWVEDRLPNALASASPPAELDLDNIALTVELACSMMQNDRLVDLTGPNAYLDPLQSLEAAGAQPPYLLAHGKTDTSVPFGTSEKWANKLRDLQPEVPLLFAVNEGDHIFDREYTLDTPWMRDPIAFVEKYWPKNIRK